MSAPSPDPSLVPRIAPGQSVKVVGLGGVGSIVARYGALFLASLRTSARLVLVDGDTFEEKNASRMIFPEPANKAAVVRDDLLRGLGVSTSLSIIAIEEFVTEENVGRLVREGDIVLLSVDNHATRRLLSDHCAARLRDVTLISGGNEGVERGRRGTYGTCQIYLRRDGRDASPSLGRYHPEIRNPADEPPTEASCTESMASVPQILFANLMAAACILDALWLHLCGALHYSEIAFDVHDGLMRPVPVAAPVAARE